MTDLFEVANKQYEVYSLAEVCRFALENDTDSTPIEHRGIDRTLRLLGQMALDVLQDIEVADKAHKSGTGDRWTRARQRLEEHAREHGGDAPREVVAPDGGPSTEVMEYCEEHGLSLDWVYRDRAEEAGSSSEPSKAISIAVESLKKQRATRAALMNTFTGLETSGEDAAAFEKSHVQPAHDAVDAAERALLHLKAKSLYDLAVKMAMLPEDRMDCLAGDALERLQSEARRLTGF